MLNDSRVMGISLKPSPCLNQRPGSKPFWRHSAAYAAFSVVIQNAHVRKLPLLVARRCEENASGWVSPCDYSIGVSRLQLIQFAYQILSSQMSVAFQHLHRLVPADG